MHRHVAPWTDARVDANAGSGRLRVVVDPSGLRKELARGIFRVDAAFHRVTARGHLARRPRQGIARGNRELRRHEVYAGHHLGHRMLHLQPRVHLEKVEPAVRVFAAVAFHQELDGAGVLVARVTRQVGRRRRQALA